MILVAASVSPSSKVAYRTDLTQRRFTEAQQLVALKADTTAFSEFVSDVSTTQQDLSELSNSKDIIENSDKLIAKIDAYQIQLSQVQTQVQIAQGIPLPSASSAVPVPGSQVSEHIVCVQVITYARNPNSGVCQAFSTPCDVPTGWVSCTPSSPQPETTQAPSQPVQPTIPIQTVTPSTPITEPTPTTTPVPLAPTVVTVIASNPQKAEEVKIKISDTKEDLEKIKEKAKKVKEEAKVEEKVKEEQKKLREELKKQKEEHDESTAAPNNK